MAIDVESQKTLDEVIGRVNDMVNGALDKLDTMVEKLDGATITITIKLGSKGA